MIYTFLGRISWRKFGSLYYVCAAYLCATPCHEVRWCNR